MQELQVLLQGEFAEHPSQPLVVASLKGLLSSALGDRINYVNAADRKSTRLNSSH